MGKNSAHGIEPQHRLLRLPTGITRSFLYFGNDGILFKRFTLGDPYVRSILEILSGEDFGRYWPSFSLSWP